MTLRLHNVGKCFDNKWIFRHINHKFHIGESYAILGHNGSGKSTLLKIIMSKLSVSEGLVSYYDSKKRKIDPNNVFKHISLAAPYMELIEDFSLSEMINFHFKFKSPLKGINSKHIIKLLNLEDNKDNLLKNFSSGMKQKTKLLLAFFSDVPIILLDEPTTNLDNKGVDLYLHLIENFSKNRIVIICSNNKDEYIFCNNLIHINNYKN